MLYSVRMRAAQGGAHELGGRHISGAERLIVAERLTTVTNEMLARALSHTRGQADFININVEAVDDATIRQVQVLPVTSIGVKTIADGRQAAFSKLVEAGVETEAAQIGLQALVSLTDSMRGAMLICASTGRRLDDSAMRGVRVSRMDIADEDAFTTFLADNRLGGDHVREALVLASKVASAPGIIAELCWSDDPEYTTGYVACRSKYFRINELKEYGSALGGRVFFVQPTCDVKALMTYLESQPVLVTMPKGDEFRGFSYNLS